MASRVGPPPWSPTPKKAMRGRSSSSHARQQLVRPPTQQLVLGPAAGGVVVGDPVGGELGAVGAAPAKGGRGDVLLLRAGTHEHVGPDPRGRQQLGKGAGVPEGVDVVPDGGGDAEVPGQEPLTVEELAAHRLSGGQVAVRLDPLAAGDHPAPGAHQRANAVEQLGRGLHDPPVVAGRAGREAERRGPRPGARRRPGTSGGPRACPRPSPRSTWGRCGRSRS